jgi:hypothetical protein
MKRVLIALLLAVIGMSALPTPASAGTGHHQLAHLKHHKKHHHKHH